MLLKRPAVCSLRLIKKVVRERIGGVNEKFFSRIEKEWISRVKEYIVQSGSPISINTWPEADTKKKTFINLYKNPAEGSAQGEMLDQLDDHELDLCPACGELGRPNTLDHYLPKGKYPHFAITPLNLFPMCDACQLVKGEKTNNATDPRFFIHPYFDTFSIPQIVVLTITAPFDSPTFTVAPNPALSPAELRIVTTHLRELEVPRRYIKFFKTEHRRLLRSVSIMRQSGQDIRGTVASFQRQWEFPTPNSWQHVFYHGVLNNNQFVTYLERATLPSFL